MKTTVQPLGENVLIEVLQQEEQTKSGLYLPETATKEKPQQGTVVAVGTDDDIAVKPGQTVIFRQYAGTEVTVDEKDYLIVKKDDILATVER